MVDDNDKKEKQQAYLRAFNHYFPTQDRESGCIKQIKKDLEKIKKIVDLDEKYHKIRIAYGKHRNNENYVGSHYNLGNLSELGISRLDTIEKYHKLVKELWDLNIELIRQKEQSSTNDNKRERERERERGQSKTKSTQPTNSQQQTNQTQPTHPPQLCPTCSTPLNPNTDYFNFCSEQHYLKHYGTLCPLCNKYSLTAIYWDQENYPSLTYCLDCYEKELKRKQDSEWKKLNEENKACCQHCSIELNEFNQQNSLDCKSCWDKKIRRIQEENFERKRMLANSTKNNSVANNQITNLKKEISLLESSTNPNQSLLNSKKEELRNLENKLKESNQKTIQEQNNNSKLYWGIGGGIFGVGLVGVLVYLITKNKKEKSNA